MYWHLQKRFINGYDIDLSATMQPAFRQTGLETRVLDVRTTDRDPNTTSSPTYHKYKNVRFNITTH